ncbi:unnamed protein product [Effrenium voratum]|nr:unnamed protein product [Effrenium voratum]
MEMPKVPAPAASSPLARPSHLTPPPEAYSVPAMPSQARISSALELSQRSQAAAQVAACLRLLAQVVTFSETRPQEVLPTSKVDHKAHLHPIFLPVCLEPARAAPVLVLAALAYLEPPVDLQAYSEILVLFLERAPTPVLQASWAPAGAFLVPAPVGPRVFLGQALAAHQIYSPLAVRVQAQALELASSASRALRAFLVAAPAAPIQVPVAAQAFLGPTLAGVQACLVPTQQALQISSEPAVVAQTCSLLLPEEVQTSLVRLREEVPLCLERLREEAQASLVQLREEAQASLVRLREEVPLCLERLREEAQASLAQLREEAQASLVRLREQVPMCLVRLREEAQASLVQLREEAQVSLVRLREEGQASLVRHQEEAPVSLGRLQEEPQAALVRLQQEVRIFLVQHLVVRQTFSAQTPAGVQASLALQVVQCSMLHLLPLRLHLAFSAPRSRVGRRMLLERRVLEAASSSLEAHLRKAPEALANQRLAAACSCLGRLHRPKVAGLGLRQALALLPHLLAIKVLLSEANPQAFSLLPRPRRVDVPLELHQDRVRSVGRRVLAAIFSHSQMHRGRHLGEG